MDGAKPRRSPHTGMIVITVLALLAACGLWGWSATAGWRAQAATRGILTNAAAAMQMAHDLPPGGPLPIHDAWNRAVRMVESPLGRWLESDGNDGVSGSGDDVRRLIALSALGRAIDDTALAIRQGGTPDLDTLSLAASTELGQPVEALIRDDIVFENASGEVVFAVALSPLGDPDLP
jgi:hypothetical protein